MCVWKVDGGRYAAAADAASQLLGKWGRAGESPSSLLPRLQYRMGPPPPPLPQWALDNNRLVH